MVDNKTIITVKLKKMKKPSLAKLDLEKERLYGILDGQTLSERLETYGIISDVRLWIEKMASLSEMIDVYIGIARKISKEFDIVLAKDLFSSFVVKGFDVHLIVSLGGDGIKNLPKKENRFHLFDNQITHLFKEKVLKFYLYVH